MIFQEAMAKMVCFIDALTHARVVPMAPTTFYVRGEEGRGVNPCHSYSRAGMDDVLNAGIIAAAGRASHCSS